MRRALGPTVAGALAASFVVFLLTFLADQLQHELAARAAAPDSIDLSFTLPSHEALGCGEANAPCTDLDSALLYRQDRYQHAAVTQRAGVRGREGQAWRFRVPAALQAVYYVTTKDSTGNETCGSNLVQIASAVTVPLLPDAAPGVAALYDIAGRKIPASMARPGVYFERIGRGPARRVVVIQ